MNIKKVIITKGTYDNKELRLLVSFDELDNPLDIINIDESHVGEVRLAIVEKVLKDIDACILRFEDGSKGFIENRKLNKDYFLEIHSENKPVCQGDRFYVQISQDSKDMKPMSCNFVKETAQDIDLISYYLDRYASDAEIISDIANINSKYNYRLYSDDSISLWQLYDITKIIDRATSKTSYLKGGGNIVIEHTEAMTVIDVNTASNYGKTSSIETNIQAVEEIARHIRLRSISGIIVIDFLKVNEEQQAQIIDAFKTATSDDYAMVRVHDFTRLGLLEVTRSRIYRPFEIIPGKESV